MKSLIGTLAFSVSAVVGLAQIATVGAPLPPWTPGTLDIHQIATGRGNAALFVLPDGTTLLVDAGAAGDGIADTDPHPDASLTPGAWIARYLARHGVTELDYALITHFHDDHMGQVLQTSPSDRTGSYKLSGITEVAETVPIHKLLDRGWPDYSYPATPKNETMANYRHFLDSRKGRMQVERFKPASASQIVLIHDAASYPGFEIRNIVGNGEVWTGIGQTTRQLFPKLDDIAPADTPSENMCSNGFRLRYGDFRYFTGGDLPGTPDPGFPKWHNLEAAIAGVIGRVDVHVVNQHGSMEEESEAFLEALRSTVLIVPSWRPSHPAPDVLKRVVNSRLPPSQRYIFATDFRNATRIVIGPRANQLAGPVGHVVVRVDPGGSRYSVYVLNNRDQRDLIVGAKGPFHAGE